MGKFVSRGGEKLQHALDSFEISVKGLICADFGASTGGFTDCLLQNGAAKVYAVEVGYGTLDWKLRNDPRIVVMERTNAMHVVLPEKVDLITIDAGWTKQKSILPNAFANLKTNGRVISLVKPQYEAGSGLLRGGKIEENQLEEILNQVKFEISLLGGKFLGSVTSPILGGKGKNKEFLFLIRNSH